MGRWRAREASLPLLDPVAPPPGYYTRRVEVAALIAIALFGCYVAAQFMRAYLAGRL